MVPSGRRHPGKSAKTPAEDQPVRAYDLEKEDKLDQACAQEGIAEVNTSAMDKLGKKRTSAVVEDVGGAVQNMLEKFGADINNALTAKRKRLAVYTKASLKTSNQKMEHIWKTQQDKRQKLKQEYSQHFLTLFQQWEIDVQKAEEREEKLANLFRQQQNILQQLRVVQGQRLKTIKRFFDQFLKSIGDLEKNHDTLLTGAQNELKKEMAMLQKQIMMDTQQQEMANVRKSLQSMFF